MSLFEFMKDWDLVESGNTVKYRIKEDPGQIHFVLKVKKNKDKYILRANLSASFYYMIVVLVGVIIAIFIFGGIYSIVVEGMVSGGLFIIILTSLLWVILVKAFNLIEPKIVLNVTNQCLINGSYKVPFKEIQGLDLIMQVGGKENIYGLLIRSSQNNYQIALFSYMTRHLNPWEQMAEIMVQWFNKILLRELPLSIKPKSIRPINYGDWRFHKGWSSEADVAL